jgi:hypothetical protein
MCEKLIEDFGATWKAVFVQLSGEVMNFSNFIKGYADPLCPSHCSITFSPLSLFDMYRAREHVAVCGGARTVRISCDAC